MLHSHSEVVLTDNPTKFELTNNETEVHKFDYDQIGIDEIRSLIVEAHRKPAEAGLGKSILVRANKISSEAQQASLKIIEEPPEGVQITLVLPIGTQLLPTIISRVQLRNVVSSNETRDFEQWLQLPYAERIALVDEKIKSKEIGWQRAIKNGLQEHLAQTNSYSAAVLQQLNMVVNELLNRGASNKMLLEHLALSLPLTATKRK